MPVGLNALGYARTMEPIENADLERLVAPASQLYVGVSAKHGPHVTPELFAASGGRLWCMTSAVTLKAKVLAHDDRIAFLATHDHGDVVGIGRASVIDPARPASIAGNLTSLARSPLGAARFVARNLDELAGAARDALAGRLGGPIPPHRVVVAIEILAIASVENGALAGAWGWPDLATGTPRLQALDPAAAKDSDPAADALNRADLPEALERLTGDGGAALGWLTNEGHPLVLPASWIRDTCVATVDAELWDVCGAASSARAAITRDGWTGYGPSGKQGVLLRGHGTAASNGGKATVALAVESVTSWDGVETVTAKPA
ncbi:MAG TPA: hypothetical protein VNB24_09780 [Acidimicrobiales bacterium]|nr:hypothetical protein [Acidimicrobiales bacterium]